MIADFESFARTPGSVFLDSHYNGSDESRYSVMASNPFLIFSARRGVIEITTAEKTETFEGNALETLERLLQQYKVDYDEPYGPGAFGYMSYELGYSLHKLPLERHDDLLLPDIWFAFYDEVTVTDHRRETNITDKVKTGCKPVVFPPNAKTGASPKQTASLNDYTNRYQKIMDHIAAGNIYQANLCERFIYPSPDDPWKIYKRLRIEHPTAYSAYLNTGKNQILSLSPELFLRKRGSLIGTAPIKGTVRKNDNIAVGNLPADKKNRAEHIMIVDLERNDLGRICRFGTVLPKEMMRLESCGSVVHMVTTVEGKLRKDASLAEIFQATFPGGSVTGAPKRKAIEIIGSLEPVVRGLYTGAIGWIGFSGDFVFNLPIRTILIQDDHAFLYLGSGIVSDSSAASEYQEILDKGEPFFAALGAPDASRFSLA